MSKALTIPGLISNFHVRKIYETVKYFLPTNEKVLEIGCGYGRSTWAILDAMQNNQSLDVLDCFKLTKEPILEKNLQATLKFDDVSKEFETIRKLGHKAYFLNRIRQHPNSQMLRRIYDMRSKSFIDQDTDKNYYMIYLDGDHAYEAVKTQLDYFADVKIICGDDYNNNHPGVIRAVNEFVSKHNYDLETSNCAFWKINKKSS